MASRRALLTAGAGLVAGLTTAGCGSSKPKWSEPGGGKGKPSPTSAVHLTVTPAADTKEVSPGAPVVVVAEGGTLQTVAVAAGDKTVAGAIDADHRSWRSTGSLEYGKTYTVTVAAVDPAGMPLQYTGSFDTIKPTATTSVIFQANALVALKTGATYGIGQPVIVAFGREVKDRAAAQQAITVVTEPAVEGRWRWINTKTAHWRPEKYWAPGTKITIRANVLGVNLGNGVYGAANAATNFVIGPAQIAVADGSTHHMLVYINGTMVRDIPVSLGMGGTFKTPDGRTVNYATNAGPHIVLNKEPQVQMTSGSYGVTNSKDPNYYDEIVKLACRVSYSGEYVHLADWPKSMNAQGHSNVSHGCINVGPSHAQWFYDTFRIGDVVDVKNTDAQLAVDNGLGDWTIPWAQW
jgi:lipoprotein-anchoring transpeptidase ErfK/SrfK